MLPAYHVCASVGTSKWFYYVSKLVVMYFWKYVCSSCLKCIWRWVWPEHCKCGDAWSADMKFCLPLQKKSTDPPNTSVQLPPLGWLMLPQRKLRKIRIVLNLCPSHTEIFSKRRKIYSWLCERLELMWQPLKNGHASRALGNAFDLDFEFH